MRLSRAFNPPKNMRSHSAHIRSTSDFSNSLHNFSFLSFFLSFVRSLARVCQSVVNCNPYYYNINISSSSSSDLAAVPSYCNLAQIYSLSRFSSIFLLFVSCIIVGITIFIVYLFACSELYIQNRYLSPSFLFLFFC